MMVMLGILSAVWFIIWLATSEYWAFIITHVYLAAWFVSMHIGKARS